MPQIEIERMTFEVTVPESGKGFWLKVGCGAGRSAIIPTLAATKLRW